MKKIILGTLAIGMCLTLTACGTSAKTDATISSLSNQLDHTANIISNVQTISPTQITAEKMSDYASYNATNAQNNLTDEEYLKIGILHKTAFIKNNLSNLKLSKIQSSAVRDLTDDLSKYTNSVSNSKTELSNTIKSIGSLKKNYEKNEDRINAKLNRLANNSNARLSYYQNILNTLDQLEQYLKTDTTKAPTNLGVKIADVKDVKNQNNTEASKETTNTTENNSKTTLQKNIDTYLPETTCPECGKKVNGKVCSNCGKEIVTPINQSSQRQINTNNNPMYPVAPINNMPINGYGYYGNNPANPYRFNSNNINYANYPYGGYGMYGGYGGYGGNYAYGYNNMGRFNPNRNTDTYAPYMRNIDTYKGFGYGENTNTTFENTTTTNVNKEDSKEIDDKKDTQESVNGTSENVSRTQDVSSTQNEKTNVTDNVSTKPVNINKYKTEKQLHDNTNKQAKAHNLKEVESETDAHDLSDVPSENENLE